MNKRSFIICFLALTPFLTKAQGLTPDMQYWVPYDQRSVNQFEPAKEDSIGFDELKARIGADLTMQFQALDHENDALDNDDGGANELQEIGPGFNLATANLNLDVQLADGVRMNMVTYLSSRHHPDAWVKGGYIQLDEMKFLNSDFVDGLMDKLRFRVGHMEINYGDAHFRRTDNGRSMQNPFVGNYIMDAFTTEIGGEAYFMHKGWLAMGAVTNGEINGAVAQPDDREPSFYGKLGFDKQLSEDFRLRLTGSGYNTVASQNNTLYSGDRAGSRYYGVMMNSSGDNFTSGRFNPGFQNRVTAFVVNPFIKWKGLELFANLEQAEGRAHGEEESRVWQQMGGELLYRFGEREQFYVGGRFDQVAGELTQETDGSIQRLQGGLGAFVTENILAKLEYVQQEYDGFPEADIRHGGAFSGIMLEGVVAF